MNGFYRMWLGIILTCLGFWLGVARALGAFGNPTATDGALLAVLLLVGPGIYLVATQLHDDIVSRETSKEDEHGKVH